MLSKAAQLLLPAAGRPAARASAAPLGALAPSLRRAFAAGGGGKASEGDESSYSAMKDAANKTGNPSKEWMQGAKEHASAYAQSAEELFEATKRATQDVTTHAKEASQRTGFKDVKQMASGGAKGASRAVEGMAAGVASAAGAAGATISGAASRAAEAVEGAIGAADDLPSARAEFSKSRSPEQLADENKDRKSQLTDEATTGDNPAEQLTRDEHRILPNEFYTKH